MNAPADGIEIRAADAGEVVEAVTVFEAAMLVVDVEDVRALADDGADGAVLVAVDTGTTSRTPSGRVVLGALVLEGRTIEALAVRPRRRGQGIGSALVRAADDRTSRPLRASFDADLRPFYERLGFAVEATETGRCHGRRDGEKED